MYYYIKKSTIKFSYFGLSKCAAACPNYRGSFFFLSKVNVHIVNFLFISHELFDTSAPYVPPYYLSNPLATLHTKSLALKKCTFFPQNVFLCSVRISEKKKRYYLLYSTNWKLLQASGVCLLRGTD